MIQPINLERELLNDEYWLSIVKRYVDNDKSFLGIDSIENMQRDILTHKWGYPKRILIPKPNGKMREIFSFGYRDAFYQKVIGAILYTKFNSLVNPNVFSYREGIKVSDGARHIQSALNTSCYGLKLDISNYFLSIEQNIIFAIIDNLISDDWGRSTLKQLFSINAFIDHEGNTIEKYLSIMPGCAISSFLANYILKDVDNYLSSNTIKYARYSDDLIFFTEIEHDMKKCLNNVKSLISKIGLDINPDKVEIVKQGKDKGEVTFLGLAITNNSIDLATKSYKEIKKKIKSILRYCENLFYLDDKYKYKSKDYQLQFAIYKIYKYLYNVSINNQKFTSIMQYAFTNITQYKNLIQLDFYIKDRLRQFYTGKNNKANAYKCSTDKLEELGYRPVMWFYNMYKTDKELFLTEAQVLLRNIATDLFSDKLCLATNIPISKYCIGKSIRFDSYISFIQNVSNPNVNIGTMIDNQLQLVNISNIQIDFTKKVIYLNHTPIIKGTEFVGKNMYLITCSKGILLASKVEGIQASPNEYNKAMVMYYYLNCFTTYSTRSKWYNKESMKDIPLRDFNLNYISKLIDVKHMQQDNPYENRKLCFALLLYFSLVYGKINNDLVKLHNKYTTKYKLQCKKFPAIIIPEEWVM